jgi:hypothetical protein
MRPTDEDTPDRGDGDSLADGVGEVSSSTDPFGDELSDDDFDDELPDDTYGDDTYTEDTYGDGDGFGDGSTDPAETVDDGVDDTGTGDDDVTVLDPDDQLPELEIVGHENSPFESVGHLIEEIGDALFGDDADDDQQALAAAASPFDADPADIASDNDLDLTGDGVVDRADLHEATSVFDFGVAGPHHHHDVGDG